MNAHTLYKKKSHLRIDPFMDGFDLCDTSSRSPQCSKKYPIAHNSAPAASYVVKCCGCGLVDACTMIYLFITKEKYSLVGRQEAQT